MDRKEYLLGIEKSLENAKDLFDDAEILFEHKRFPRAYTLYHLSIEELGKSSLIFHFILYGKSQEIKYYNQIKKKLSNHQEKNKSSIGLDTLLAFTISDEKLKKKIIHQIYKQENELEKLNNLKNSSLYTDVDIKNKKFIKPKEIITEQLVAEIKFIAQVRLNTAKAYFKLAIENFDELYEDAQNINKDELINNPPKEIIELANLKIADMKSKVK
ncbi:MAG: AbiV family abortive infection protein [Flavobacteriaceae bacterium]